MDNRNPQHPLHLPPQMSSNAASSSSSPTSVSSGRSLPLSSSSYPPPDGRFSVAVPLPFRKDGRPNPEWGQGRLRRATAPSSTDNEDDEASIRAATAMIAMRQRQSRQQNTGAWQPSAQSIFSFKRAFNATMAAGGGSGSRIGVLDSPTRAMSTATASPAVDDGGQTSSGGGGVERDVTLTPINPAVRSRPQHVGSPASELTTSPRVVSLGEPLSNDTRSHQPRPHSPNATLRHYRRSAKRGHDRPPVHHPGYDLGQPGRELDMVLVPHPNIGRLAASFLRLHDGAFVLRTDGAWTYAIVAEVVTSLPPSSSDDGNVSNVEKDTSNEEDRGFTLRFVTDFDGSCKSIPEGKWGTHIRLIRSSSSRGEIERRCHSSPLP